MDSLEALILDAEDHKESDRLLTLLDASGRVLRVYASHARSSRSRMAAVTAPFVYGRFEVKQNTTGGYLLQDVEVRESFLGLQNSLPAYALAAYLAELTAEVLHSEPEPTLLPLLLNTLHLIAAGKRPLPLLKGIYEWRIAVLAGYAPSLERCDCRIPSGGYNFTLSDGHLYCENCRGVGTFYTLPMGTLEGMRRACFAENPFGFTLTGESLTVFSRLAERYLRYHMELKLDTLDYYHDVAGSILTDS